MSKLQRFTFPQLRQIAVDAGYTIENAIEIRNGFPFMLLQLRCWFFHTFSLFQIHYEFEQHLNNEIHKKVSKNFPKPIKFKQKTFKK